jgi:two-component sensor histidine kinase
VKGKPIQFNTGKEVLKIYLANRDYTFGAGYTFKYSLDSKTWFKVDQKNYILLSNLAYGDYILKIRMFNPFGQLVEEKAIQVFAIVPFYAKSSFLWFVIGLLIAMSILTILYFIRSIRVRAETKAKIAMDLHDESGTILTRLLILVNREKFEDHEKDILKSGLKEALYSFRTYLDSISKTKCTWVDLSDELKEFVSKACQDAAIEPKMEMQADKDYQLKGELARDIKLLVYEMVTNSIKHANAKQLILHCRLKNNQFRMMISDTGKCDLAELEVFKGNGIRNLKKRISRNNGRLMYYIPEGSTGLTVEVFLPLN